MTERKFQAEAFLFGARPGESLPKAGAEIRAGSEAVKEALHWSVVHSGLRAFTSIVPATRSRESVIASEK
jgi:hypothetical protein